MNPTNDNNDNGAQEQDIGGELYEGARVEDWHAMTKWYYNRYVTTEEELRTARQEIERLRRAAEIGAYWMASYQCESQEEGDLLTKQEEIVHAALAEQPHPAPPPQEGVVVDGDPGDEDERSGR